MSGDESGVPTPPPGSVRVRVRVLLVLGGLALAVGLVWVLGTWVVQGVVSLSVAALALLGLLWTYSRHPGSGPSRKQLVRSLPYLVVAVGVAALGIWLLTSD